MSEKITINDIKDLDKYETTEIQDAKSLDGKFVEEIEEYIKFFKKFDNNEIKKILSLPKDIIKILKSFDNNEVKKILSLPEDIIQYLKSFENKEVKKILSLREDKIRELKSFENKEVKKILSHTGILYLKILVNCEEVEEGLFILGEMIYSDVGRWREKVVLYKNYRDNSCNYYKNMFIPLNRISKENSWKYKFEYKFVKGACWEENSNYKVEFDKEGGKIIKDGKETGEVKVKYLNVKDKDNIWILILKCNTTFFSNEKDEKLRAIDWKDEYVYN